MRITVNLATRPYTDIGPAIKRLRIAMAVLLLIGIGLALGVHAFHQQAVEARSTEERVQKRIDAIQRERQGYDAMMHQPANALLLSQVGTLNQLFDEKTFSWTLGMEDLETVLPGRVQVISLEPVRDTKTGVITLHLRVVGPRDRSVELVANLEHSRQFLLPRIVGESSDSTNAPGERLEPVSASNRVNFEVLADYNSAAPIESRAEKMADEKRAEEQKPKGGAMSASRLQAAPMPRMAHPLPIPAPPDRQAHPGPSQNRPLPNPIPNRSWNPGGPR